MRDNLALSILVVEDDNELRELLLEVLEENGYQVEGASSGHEAIEKARESAFDLVITDIRMGEMNGLEALLEVKEDTTDFESMVITGYADEEIPAQALRMGVGEYLKKPFELDQFVAAVERLLSNYREKLYRQADEADTRRAAIWGCEGKAIKRNNTHIVAASRLSWEVAGELGFTTEEAEKLQLGTLLALLSDTEDPPPGELCTRLLFLNSSRAKTLLNTVGELYEKQLILPERPYIESVPDDLEGEQEVLQALRELSQFGGMEISQDPIDHRRCQGLKSLAEALLQRGDHRGAAQAFATLTKQGGAKEIVEAHLGLARAHRVAEKPEAACKWAMEAVSKAEALGPSARTLTALEAASNLRLLNDSKAERYIALAGTLVEQNGLVEMEPLVDLSAQLVGAQSLHPNSFDQNHDIFLSSGLPRLKSSLRWFLPLVFHRLGKNSELEELCSRLVLLFPEQTRNLISTGELSGVGARSALKLLDRSRNSLTTDKVNTPSPTTDQPVLRCYSLGVFEVYLGEEMLSPQVWKSQKIKYLLAYLAAHRGRPVPEDRILDEFWEGLGKSNLYSGCSYLRKHLRLPSSKTNYIVRRSGMLSLNDSLPFWHDLSEVESLDSKIRQLPSDDPRVPQLSRQLIALHRGPYLDGCTMSWAEQSRIRINRIVIDSYTRLIEWCRKTSNATQMAEYANSLLEMDVCNQEANLGLIESMVLAGKPEQAARQYEVFEKNMDRELGLELPIDAVRSYHQIMMSVKPVGH